MLAGFDLTVSDSTKVAMSIEYVDGIWPVVVIDGVYANPDSVHALASQLSFHHRNGNYPGHMASISLSLEPLKMLILEMCGTELGHLLGPHRYYLDHVFAVIDDDIETLNPRQRQPHYDDFCDAAGVVYLTKPEFCAGGTSFWRHRRTGLVRVPDTLEDEWAADAIFTTRSSSVEALVRNCLDEAMPDPGPGFPSKMTEWWQPELLIPMRWNRLVIYDSRLFHTPDVPQRFGTTNEERRLTQNLYFSRSLT
jgi:hypothetical protein